MANEVDICNMALSHLARRAEITAINPPDGSPEANLCSKFYYTARDMLLEKYEWHFAKYRVALADAGTAPDEWAYKYLPPSDMLRPLALYKDGEDRRLNPGGHPFVIEREKDATAGERTVIYTDIENAVLHYTAIVADTTLFTPTFTVALSWLLASLLAGPLTQNSKKKQECEVKAWATAGEAAMLAGNYQKRADKAMIDNRYPIGAPRRSVGY